MVQNCPKNQDSQGLQPIRPMGQMIIFSSSNGPWSVAHLKYGPQFSGPSLFNGPTMLAHLNFGGVFSRTMGHIIDLMGRPIGNITDRMGRLKGHM